jgi:hypothetical protein
VSATAVAEEAKPVRIGVPTSVQLQVGRDTLTAIKMAVDEVNKKGGVLGRKLEFVSADETENPETGINAIRKLVADEKVDVLIGGYTSGVTLAQLPHIAAAKMIYLGVGAASPSITNKVKTDYDHLFLQRDVYDYKLDYELSIIGYYCNYMNFDLIKACMKVLACSMVDESTIKNVLSNYKFYTTSLIEKGLYNNNVKVLKTIGETLDINKTDFVSSTPSLCLNENGELEFVD